MKIKSILLALSLACSPLAFAQSAPTPMPAVPTTRVICIGHLTTTRDKIMPLMQEEVTGTVRLYLGGKLDQWYSRNDTNGVVFILNVTTVAEARALLEALPLGKGKLLEFEYIPVGPLSPLNLLLKDKPAPPQAK